MRTIMAILAIFLLLSAPSAGAREEESAQAGQSAVSVEFKLLSDSVAAGRDVRCELKITNLLDRPVRFCGDLGAMALPTFIDENGRVHRSLCEIEAIDCERRTESESVLLPPRAFYGQRFYVPCLNIGPGNYNLKLKVYLQSCADWPDAIRETLEPGPVPLIVRERTE